MGEQRFVERRAYLQCLLSLERLRNDGLVLQPSAATAAYYEVVLRARRPGSVPLFRPAQVYKGLLGSEPASGQCDPENGDDGARSPSALSDTPVIGATLRLDGPQQGPTPPADARQDPDPQGQARRIPAVSPESSDSDSTSSATSSCASAVPTAPRTVTAAPYEQCVARDICTIRSERHKPGSLPRLYADCPLRHGAHFSVHGCRKHRNTGSAQCSRHGPLEPEAYLAAWAAAAGRFHTREDHMRYVPDRAAVREMLLRLR